MTVKGKRYEVEACEEHKPQLGREEVRIDRALTIGALRISAGSGGLATSVLAKVACYRPNPL